MQIARQGNVSVHTPVLVSQLHLQLFNKQAPPNTSFSVSRIVIQYLKVSNLASTVSPMRGQAMILSVSLLQSQVCVSHLNLQSFNKQAPPSTSFSVSRIVIKSLTVSKLTGHLKEMSSEYQRSISESV
jgi:hypothetical protein